jgi:(p)ppGpp synthase/HD superfamily hydrolase
MQNINCWESKFQLCQYSDKLLRLVASLNKIVKNPVDIHQIQKACYYAREYHRSQLRKSGEPYYSHLLEVAMIACKFPRLFTTNFLVTAILHDCIEDTTLTSEIIATIFNQEVARGVEDLTRIKNGAKVTAAETLVLLYGRQNKREIVHIKLCDRLHNMQTIGAMKPEKVKKIVKETAISFLVSSADLELYEMEEALVELCLDAISNLNLEQKDLFEDNSLLLSLGFRND